MMKANVYEINNINDFIKVWDTYVENNTGISFLMEVNVRGINCTVETEKGAPVLFDENIMVVKAKNDTEVVLPLDRVTKVHVQKFSVGYETRYEMQLEANAEDTHPFVMFSYAVAA